MEFTLGKLTTNPLVLEYLDKKLKFAKFADKFKNEFKALASGWLLPAGGPAKLGKKMERKIDKEWVRKIAEEEHFKYLAEGRKSAVQLRHKGKSVHPNDFGYKNSTRDFWV